MWEGESLPPGLKYLILIKYNFKPGGFVHVWEFVIEQRQEKAEGKMQATSL